MPPSPRNSQPFLVQLGDLFLIELTNWRWSWRSMLLTATITPLFGIIALGIFARDSGPSTLAYVLTGNLVLSLLFGAMDKVQSRFTYMRVVGALDYFAALPIQRYSLILAVAVAFFLLSLPSLLATLGVGALLLNLSLHLHPLLLIVIPVCALSLAGLGAFIGVTVRDPHEGGSLSLLVTLVLAGLGPVAVPPERLPGIFLILGRFSPATYAASALRQVILGPVTLHLWLDLGVLIAFAVAFLWLVGWKMDWRGTS